MIRYLLLTVALSFPIGVWAEEKERAEPAKAPAPEPAKPAEPAKQIPGEAVPPPNLGSGLKRVAPDTWELGRDEAYQLIASMPFLSLQVWVSEVRRGGELIGYKLRHIAKGSQVERAGFQNDDILMTVNGQGLEEPWKLLLHLLDSDRIELKIERDGKVITQTYRLVP